MSEQLPPFKHGPFRDAVGIVVIAGMLAGLLEIVVPSTESFQVFVALLIILFGYSILDEVWSKSDE